MRNALSAKLPKSGFKPTLDWLARIRGRTSGEEIRELQDHLQILRNATLVPAAQRLRLLDLLHDFGTALTRHHLPQLQESTLPTPPAIRQLARSLQDTQEVLAQAYLEILPPLFKSDSRLEQLSGLDAVSRALQSLSWHLRLSHLTAAPPGSGIWRQLHATFQTARHLGLDQAGSRGDRINQIYLSSLLLAVVHPTSFTAQELEFISFYIDHRNPGGSLSTESPTGHHGIFWINLEEDSPPHALARRPPPPETAILYFAGDLAARQTSSDLSALTRGATAAALDLPDFAATPAGRSTLDRLRNIWGRPPKRRHPRRRQSCRAHLLAGFECLRVLPNYPEDISGSSEWMITNESPDGYAMMHVRGPTQGLQVGDIVALKPHRLQPAATKAWQICIVRWALSENPEHIELGLQILATHGTPARLSLASGKHTEAILLPEAPPLRPSRSLILPAGISHDPSQKLIVLVEQGNLAILELRATRLEERTSSIEIFNVEPDGRP